MNTQVEADLVRHESECDQAAKDMEAFGDEARERVIERLFTLPKDGLSRHGISDLDGLLDAFFQESLVDWILDWQRFRQAVAARDSTEIGHIVQLALERCAAQVAERSTDEIERIVAELAEENGYEI